MSERRAKQARRLERIDETGTADRKKVRVGRLSRPEPGSWDPGKQAMMRAKLRRSFKRMLEL
jgi:hypothetical protein